MTYGKGYGNKQTAQAMQHLIKECSEDSYAEDTIAILKVKPKSKKEVTTRNIIISCKSEEYKTSKRQKGKNQMQLPGAPSLSDVSFFKKAF